MLRVKLLYACVVLVTLLLILYPVLYNSLYSGGSRTNPLSCAPLIPCASIPQAKALCGQTCIVDMANSTFSPQAIKVRQGDVVEWVNLDGFPHTSTSLDPGGWNSPFIGPGETYILNTSYLAPGTYYYRCTIHPAMIGELTVVNASQP